MSTGNGSFFRPKLMALESREAPAIMSIPHLPTPASGGVVFTPLALQIARAVMIRRTASAAAPVQQHLPPVTISPFTQPAGISVPGLEFLAPVQSANLFHNTNHFVLGPVPNRLPVPAWVHPTLTTG